MVQERQFFTTMGNVTTISTLSSPSPARGETWS